MIAITFLKGDATKPAGPAGQKIIAHCCNNIGVWSAGFVLALSKVWPQPEAEYRLWAKEEAQGLPIGGVQFVDCGGGTTVANIIGQFSTVPRDGIPPIRYPAIWRGLDGVGIRARRAGGSVHMPRIGCGLAGGEWAKIERLVIDTLCRRNIETFVYDWS